jgi:hypothetical protein
MKWRVSAPGRRLYKWKASCREGVVIRTSSAMWLELEQYSMRNASTAAQCSGREMRRWLSNAGDPG